MRPLRLVPGLLAAVLLALALPAHAAYVASPVGEVGTIPVGTPVTFHIVQADEDGLPSTHTDAPVRITLDGELVYATTQTGSHEYDGIHTVTVAFPREGRYEVQALDGDTPVSISSGRVTAHPAAGRVLDANSTGTFPIATSYQLSTDLHTETLLRATEDGRSALRTSLHAHAEPQQFLYMPVADGTFASVHSPLQVPEGAAAFAPFLHELAYNGPPAALTPGSLVLPSAQPRNTVTVSEGDGMVLVATYDPYTVVGPETMMRIAILALDPDTRQPLPHTQFEALLEGPRGTEFASGSIHEHDGVWEFAARRPVGGYTLHVEAENGDRSAHIAAGYQVTPALEARSLGMQTVALQLPEEGGTTYTVTITDALGRPFDHGEVLIDLVDAAGIPVLSAKVHAHADGTYVWDMAVPPGDHTLRLEPFALEARPVTFTGDLEHAFSTPGPALAAPVVEARDTSALGLAYLSAGVLAAAAFLAAAAKRR